MYETYKMPDHLSTLFRFFEHEESSPEDVNPDIWIVSCGHYDDEYRIYRIMFKSERNPSLNIDDERIIPMKMSRAKKSIQEFIASIYKVLQSNAYSIKFKRAAHKLLLEDPWIAEFMELSKLTVSSFQTYSSGL